MKNASEVQINCICIFKKNIPSNTVDWTVVIKVVDGIEVVGRYFIYNSYSVLLKTIQVDYLRELVVVCTCNLLN